MLYVHYAHSYFWHFYNYNSCIATSIFHEFLHLHHRGVFVFQLLQCFCMSITMEFLSSNYYIASQVQHNLSFLYSASASQLQCNFKLVSTFGKVSFQISLFCLFFFLIVFRFTFLVLLLFCQKKN
jgi:hypothetical protein